MRGARELKKFPLKVPRGRGRTGGQSHELTGQGGCVSVKKDELAFPSCTVNGIQNPPEPLPNTKIKLQLYPIDGATCIGLEKDGINPYLELTLKPTKRISSVLKHINNKWGCSKIALGEPMLLPYDIRGDISHCRMWTMKDNDTRAGDVYTSIGRPATFRLRYGWVPPIELKTSEEPSTAAISHMGCLLSDDGQKDCSSDVKNTDKDEDIQRTDSQYGQSATPWINELTNVSIGALLSEASLQAQLNTDKPRPTENDTDLHTAPTSYPKPMFPEWADGLTDISIGGLFSEASLQGKFNSGNTPKSITGNADSTQIFSDSLDAFIAAQMRCPQGPKPPYHDLPTFILDGEDTCHAFPVPKFSSSGKRISAISGSSGGGGQDSGSRSFKFPKIDKINTEAGVSEDRPRHDSQTDLFLSPRTYNDENSLGLTNIKWGDSLGPFDLGLSASRKLIKEETRQQL